MKVDIRILGEENEESVDGAALVGRSLGKVKIGLAKPVISVDNQFYIQVGILLENESAYYRKPKYHRPKQEVMGATCLKCPWCGHSHPKTRDEVGKNRPCALCGARFDFQRYLKLGRYSYDSQLHKAPYVLTIKRKGGEPK